jgi:PAS domain S-box-containing protein
MARENRKNISRVAHWLAVSVVAILALLPPSVYFVIAWQSQSAAVETEAEINARLVTQLINANPEMWRYEKLRLEGLLIRRSDEVFAESRRILDMDGTVVMEHAERLEPPVITHSRWLYDSGVPVGRLEVSRSLKPVASRTVVLALVGGLFGLAAFFLLRTFPLAVVHDALDSLSREKSRAKITLRSIADGVVTTDTEDRVVFLNRAAEAILGWSRREAAGRPIGEVFPMEGADGNGAPCAAVPKGGAGTGYGRMRAIAARDGTERLIEETASPIVNEHGRTVGCVLVIRDVTEKVRTEEELARVQKLESLGILAGGIAHEIRNPLSGVNIYVSALERLCEHAGGLEPAEREQILSITEQVRSASDKIAAIVKRVMEFAKPSPRLAGRVDVNRPAQEAILLSAATLRQKGIALDTALQPDLPGCAADPRLLEQVLLNLILNAAHAVESHEGEKRIAVDSFLDNGRIVVSVADSGPGVPAHLRERIFDPFFTTKKEGTGIGLSFSRRVVAEHGGTLSVRTSRWGGAEFRIELPTPLDAMSA